jgi:hypothetical protein
MDPTSKVKNEDQIRELLYPHKKYAHIGKNAKTGIIDMLINVKNTPFNSINTKNVKIA